MRGVFFLGLLLLLGACSDAVDSITYEPTPESILTPDRVESRLGTLEFFDGFLWLMSFKILLITRQRFYKCNKARQFHFHLHFTMLISENYYFLT